MIDLTKAKEEFEKFLDNFNREDEKIKLKIKHTYNVMKMSEYIANEMKLTKRERNLAMLIGLLHDIGRFVQVRDYNTFNDRISVDHAELGVKILFEKGLIGLFTEDKECYKIIEKAICNHNKYSIEKGLEEKEILHAKIIRDADKMDIFRVANENNMKAFMNKTEEDIKKEKISEKVYKAFVNYKQVKNEDRLTAIDNIIAISAFIFDFNFDVGLKYVQEKGYINQMLDKCIHINKETSKDMELIRKISNEYIEERCKER